MHDHAKYTLAGMSFGLTFAVAFYLLEMHTPLHAAPLNGCNTVTYGKHNHSPDSAGPPEPADLRSYGLHGHRR
jgi:hypothetical protein